MKKLIRLIAGVVVVQFYSLGSTAQQITQGGGSTILSNSPTSNTNVGIGTNNPLQTLHIKDKVGGLRVERSDGSNQSNALEIGITSNMLANVNLGPGTINFRSLNITSGAKPDMSFSANGSNHQLTLLNNGNLGLGTTTPKERFQIGDRFTIHDGGSKVIADNSIWNGTSDVRQVNGGASQIRFEQSGYNNNGGVIRLLAAPSANDGATIDYVNHTAMTIGQGSRVGIGKRIGSKMESSANPSATEGISARLHVVCENDNDKNPHNDYAIRFENLPYGYGAKVVIDRFGYLYRKSYPIWYKNAKAITNDSGEDDESDYLFEQIQQLKKEIDALKAKVK